MDDISRYQARFTSARNTNYTATSSPIVVSDREGCHNNVNKMTETPALYSSHRDAPRAYNLYNMGLALLTQFSSVASMQLSVFFSY